MPAITDTLTCPVCPRGCRLSEGQRGFCRVRRNIDGQIVSTTYGRNTGLSIDPIEKKPLYQFFPGSQVLSFGTPGCNLNCSFCQNWQLSRATDESMAQTHATPEQIAQLAFEHACKSVAYTYNDPVVWYEYAADTAKECRLRGIKNVAVTAGYINPEPRKKFFEYIDAANVDLKAISDDFYQKYSQIDVKTVQDTLRYIINDTDIWLEVTNLVIPTVPTPGSSAGNDSDESLKRLCDWLTETLGVEVPLHFSAFHPAYKLTDRPPTDIQTLLRAYRIATRSGLKYVYVGNVRSWQHESTYCPNCNKLVIGRDGYRITEWSVLRPDESMQSNACVCRYCGSTIAGHYDF